MGHQRFLKRKQKRGRYGEDRKSIISYVDAVGVLDVKLTKEDVDYLEELYVPHPIVGAIKTNPKQGVMLLDEKK